MKCDQCDNEATVREWSKKGGHTIEKHLCEECARKQGVAIPPKHQISQILTQFITAATKATPAAVVPTTPAGVCRTCGMTYAQFRHGGLLGCPDCYAVFEGQLGPLLQRAHEGGTHHQGKCPRLASPAPVAGAGPSPVTLERLKAQHAAAVAAKAERLRTLRDSLSQAVASEQYERAAKIRDEMKALGDAESTSGPEQAGEPRP